MEKDNLDEFIEELYSSDPKEPNSLQLQLPTDNTGLMASKYIFDALLFIFNQGMKTFFAGPNGLVDITSLSMTDFEKIKAYFKSFGFNIELSITHFEEHSRFPGSFVDYSTELKDCKLLLISNKNNDLYTISFPYYTV